MLDPLEPPLRAPLALVVMFLDLDGDRGEAVGHGAGGSPPGRTRRARATSPPGEPRCEAPREAPLGRLPRQLNGREKQIAAGRARSPRIIKRRRCRRGRGQLRAPPRLPRRPRRPRRDPAAADDHEDLVMRAPHLRAMGTDIELLVDGRGDDGARQRPRPSSTGSRRSFRASVGLGAVAAEPRRRGRGGPRPPRVTELALAAREQTGGRFDPTVHDAVVAAGYDRTFDAVDPTARGPRPSPRRQPRAGHGPDRARPGVRLDFGGIGKGYAAERAAELLANAGPCLVNAGGDIAVRGGAGRSASSRRGELTLELTHGGARHLRPRPPPLAARRWRAAPPHRPATGTSAESDLLRVTVVAGDAVAAEVWAKALFLAAARAAEADAAASRPCSSTADGRTRLAGGLA